MKSYTSLEQSKKLAKILPLESADMAWCNNSIKGINYTDEFSANLYTVKEIKDVFDEALVGWDKYWELIPCWSLAALLNVLKYPSLTQDVENKWFITDWTGAYPKSVHGFDSHVDACYEMIIRLHEQNIL